MILAVKPRISWKTALFEEIFFAAFVFYSLPQKMYLIQFGRILLERKPFRIERMARDAYNGSITKQKENFP